MTFRTLILTMLTVTSFCVSEEVTVVLTGTSEIGQETVKLISKNGSKALVIGRDENKLESLFQQYGCRTFKMDFNHSSRLELLGTYLENENIVISGFVIITPRPLFFSETLPPEDAWIEMFRLCYTRPLEILKRSLPYFKTDAKLVILSGVTSVQALPEYASYGVLRKMWLAEAKSLAWELGPKGVAVNTVSPGLVLTSHHLEKWEKEAYTKNIPISELLSEKARSYPSQRMTTTKDVANAIYFFLRGESNITGQNLVVDGGVSQAY